MFVFVPSPPPSREAEELAAGIVDLVRDRVAHDQALDEGDVSAALSLARDELVESRGRARGVALVLAVVGAFAGAGVLFSSMQDELGGGGLSLMVALGGLALTLVVLFLFLAGTRASR